MFLKAATAACFLFALSTPVLGQTQQTTAAASETTGSKSKVIQNSICPVSKQAVGSMGPGKKVQHKGYEFSLCCAGCMEEFNKNPDAYLDEALKSGKAKKKPKTAAPAAEKNQ